MPANGFLHREFLTSGTEKNRLAFTSDTPCGSIPLTFVSFIIAYSTLSSNGITL